MALGVGEEALRSQRGPPLERSTALTKTLMSSCVIRVRAMRGRDGPRCNALVADRRGVKPSEGMREGAAMDWSRRWAGVLPPGRRRSTEAAGHHQGRRARAQSLARRRPADRPGRIRRRWSRQHEAPSRPQGLRRELPSLAPRGAGPPVRTSKLRHVRAQAGLQPAQLQLLRKRSHLLVEHSLEQEVPGREQGVSEPARTGHRRRPGAGRIVVQPGRQPLVSQASRP